MRFGLFVLFSASSLLAGTDSATQRAVDHAVAAVKPALVRIQVVRTTDLQGRSTKYQASGSGVIISKQGHILSNHHVIGEPVRIVCTLSDNEEVEATLVGTDPLTDLAVIQLKPGTPREFPTASFGDSDALRVGENVLAMGSPLALSQSVTLGIVSNTRLIMPTYAGDRFRIEGENIGALVRWIAHDADIFPGNSGGPLVNLAGEIVGINEISFGLGGAIPGNLAQQVARQLIESGQVRRAWLGLEVQPLLKSSAVTRGVLIGSVATNSPAALAGFQPGDILVKLAGRETSVRFAEEIPLLNQFVTGLPIGKDAEAIVQRHGQTVRLTVRPNEREQPERDSTELKEWGMTVKDISATTARELRLDSRDGALVTTVRPGGPAGDAKPALLSQDIILAVNDTPIQSRAELTTLTTQLVEGQAKFVPVRVTFQRTTEQMLTVVKVGLKEIEDPGLEAQKAWLPVAIQAISRDLAQQLGDPALTGVRITQVYTGSTAEKAGLKIGDLILKLDDEPIRATQAGDEEVFNTMVRQYRIGATPALAVRRGSETRTQTVELVRAPKLEREMKKYRDHHFEFAARDMTFFDKVREGWPTDQPGVLVTEVKDGGWAALGRLASDDIILAVNDHSITDIASLIEQMRQIAAAQPRTVVLRVARGVRTAFIELEPDWETEN